MLKNFHRGLASALVAAWLLTACGGGGGSAGTSPFVASGETSLQASDMVVELSKSSVANTGSDTVTVKATVLNASRNAVKGATVAFAVDGDGILTSGGTTTGDDGSVSTTLNIGSNRANRLINVTATSGEIARVATVQVYGATLTGTVVPAVVSPGATGRVQFRLLDQAGNAMSNQAISVTATGLTPASMEGTTGVSGDFEYTFTAPVGSGTYTVTATAGGASTTPAPTVQVQSVGTVGPASGTVTSASVSANPSVVGTNVSGSNTNRTEIRALFVGTNNLPIQNVRVRFDLGSDPNSIGGSFTSGNATLYSDANGVVTTAYVPGSRSSPTDGVTVRACYGNTDTDLNFINCTTNAIVRLTVSAEPLGVSIGTNETIIVNELTYVKKFLVSVVDSSGVAKPDVNISVSLDLFNYRKGFYVRGVSTWFKQMDDICPSEDRNRNGVNEVGDDSNGSGRLEPGKSDVSVSLLQTKTRTDGTAEVQILYAKSFATWIDARITVSASGVAGTEGRASYVLTPIPADAESIKSESLPAFARSPYGVEASPKDAEGRCTNPN